MKNRIDSLKIEGYRSINTLTVDGLGHVTLVTGRNNTGKSSVLEAVRILTAESLPHVIRSILQFREEDTQDDYPFRDLSSESYNSLSSLFHGYPSFSNNVAPFKVSAMGATYSMELSIRARWMSRELEEEGVAKWVPIDEDLFGSAALDASLILEVNWGDGKSRLIPVDLLTRRVSSARLAMMQGPSYIPHVFVDPYAGRETAFFGNLWDSIALSDVEKEVIQALQIIEPSITGVSMVGSETGRTSRKAIVKVSGRTRPVAMRSFGDGINHLFGIVLSLVNAQNGILLVDEIENGLHHSVMCAAWDMIFRLARELNVQVLATTHSWDCIEAFQKAAAKDPGDGTLLRLARKGEEIIPTVFKEDDLAIVTREGIEVR